MTTRSTRSTTAVTVGVRLAQGGDHLGILTLV